MNALPDRENLVIHSTMQGLSLNNNERKEAMNGYFTLTPNSNIIQVPAKYQTGIGKRA
jgi:hypothetical protein